jgi:hypothetical protein
LDDFYFSLKYFLSFPNAGVLLLAGIIAFAALFIVIRQIINFIYILTLNAHLPLAKNVLDKYSFYVPRSGHQSTDCIDSIQKKILCKVTEIIKQSPNTIYFITGDHPSLTAGNGGKLYDKEYVPYIIICPNKYQFVLLDSSEWIMGDRYYQ